MRGPVEFLKDYLGKRTQIRIERVFTFTDIPGSETSFDPMMSTYLGGYSGGHVPEQSMFRLRGISAGTYDLYLYGAQKDVASGTDFYVQINGGSPTVKTVTPTGNSAFEENFNYARFTVVLSSVNDVVQVTAVGFLNGMQLKRV